MKVGLFFILYFVNTYLNNKLGPIKKYIDNVAV